MIAWATHNSSAIKLYTSQSVMMTHEFSNHLATWYFPQLDQCVVGSRDKIVPVNLNWIDGTSMSYDHSNRLKCFPVPHSYARILGWANNIPIIKCNIAYTSSVSLQFRISFYVILSLFILTCSLARIRFVRISQTMTVVSDEPETMISLSYRKHKTLPACPSSVYIHW